MTSGAKLAGVAGVLASPEQALQELGAVTVVLEAQGVETGVPGVM